MPRSSRRPLRGLLGGPSRLARTLGASSALPDLSRLFIVGCPRSGTTIVQATLARYARLFTLPETHCFVRLLDAFPDWVAGRDEGFRSEIERRLRSVTPGARRSFRKALSALLDDPALPMRLRPALGGRSYVLQFARLMDRAARAHGADGWIEKTPDHLAYVDLLQELIPESRFLHVIRNGADVIASVLDAHLRFGERGSPFGSDLRYWALRWNRTIAVQLGYAGDERHLIVRHEDFVSAPDTTVRRILRFAAVEIADRPRVVEPARIADLAAEPWKEASTHGVVLAPQSKVEELFGPELTRWMLKTLVDYEEVSATIRARQAATR
jgi:hypothetical protein